MDFLPQFASYRVKVYLILFALSVATVCISMQVYSIDDFSSDFTKSDKRGIFGLVCASGLSNKGIPRNRVSQQRLYAEPWVSSGTGASK
jgi:hypothetical protein